LFPSFLFHYTLQPGPSGEPIAGKQIQKGNDSQHVHCDDTGVRRCNYNPSHSKLVTSSMIVLSKPGLAQWQETSEQNFMQIHHRVNTHMYCMAPAAKKSYSNTSYHCLHAVHVLQVCC